MVSKNVAITWVVFLISVVPLFAQTTGTFQVKPSASADITNLGYFHYIVIIPYTATISINDTIIFQASSYDSAGHQLPVDSLGTLTWSGGAHIGSFIKQQENMAFFLGQVTGSDTIRVASSKNDVKSSTGTITVLPVAIQDLPGAIQDTSDSVVIAPNPFIISTTIYCMVPALSTIQLKIQDIRGTIVDGLRREKVEPGLCKFNWKNGSIRPGHYFVLVTIGGKTYTRNISLVK